MTLDHIKKQIISYYHFAKGYTHKNLIRKYFFIGILAGILLGRWIQSGTTSTTASTSEYIVTTGNIQNTIEAYGSIELVDEQKIRFNQQGEVTAVYFKKGSEVKKGDVIAELDKGSVESNILQSQISLQNAQLQLDETLNGDKSSQILQVENNLEQSKLKLNIAQKEYDILSGDLNNSGTLSDTETTIQNTKLDIQNYMIVGEKMINELDSIFGITTKYVNNSKDTQNLSRWDPSYKETIKDSILIAYKKLTALQNYFATGFASSISIADKNKIIEGLGLARDLYQTIYAACSNTYYVFENSIPSNSFTQDMINTYKNTASTYSSQSKSSLSSITTSINQITKLGSIEDDTITLESKANEIANLKNTIIIQEKTLETTKNGTTEQQLQIAQNNIRQKELALEQTKKDLENLQIVAPFDGTLRKIDFKVGDKVTSSDEKYVYLENPNLVEVTVLLDQIDVVNVKPGMKVEVVLDSYPGETFEGVLGDIDSTPTTTNGVVSYTVKVAIDKGTKIMYSGMTASVKIIIENKENVIIIPTTYIQSQGNRKFVLGKNSNQINIEVGSTDGTMTEIVSGLTEGTTITKIIKSSNNSSSPSSSFMVPGMGGGAMGGGGRPD